MYQKLSTKECKEYKDAVTMLVVCWCRVNKRNEHMRNALLSGFNMAAMTSRENKPYKHQEFLTSGTRAMHCEIITKER